MTRPRRFLFRCTACRHLVVPLLAASASWSTTVFPQPAGVVGETIELQVSADKSVSTFVLALDRFAVMATPGVDDAAAIDEIVDADGVEERKGGLRVVTLLQPSTREEINILAGKTRDDQRFVQAGMVLYPEGFESLMVVTDELVIGFKEEPNAGQLNDFARRFELEPVANDRLLTRQWLMRLTADARMDAIEATKATRDHDLVEFAHPNFIVEIDTRQIVPNDPLFNDQWHHRNDGQSGGTADADIDSDIAWSDGQGDTGVVVAVIDAGFDIAHDDLQNNLWVNPGEIANDLDDDGNGFVDDINGFNFSDCYLSSTNCGTGSLTGHSHGTAVAGLVAASANNTMGVTGVCPGCSLMLIQRLDASTSFSDVASITYAALMGADVLNNSWGYGPGVPVPGNLATAIDAMLATGTVVFWSMSNIDRDDCIGGAPDLSAHPQVAAVSAASNLDRKVTESGFGDCMDVIAPSHRGFGPNPNGAPAGSGVAYTGTLNIATTDRPGAAGDNDTTPPNTFPGIDPTFCSGESANLDYTLCFGGTSAAAPITAGVAGLILSLDDTLDAGQVRRLIQDTADKVEPMTASYDSVNGFGRGAGASRHGYGRVNAAEAVAIANPAGRNGVDVFVRDNALDWGNTLQDAPALSLTGSNVRMDSARSFEPHYVSVDIKVDAPPYQTPSTVLTAAQFAGVVHENPVSGAQNRVFVRVRNRGPRNATDVRVKLHWAFAGTALPALPADFWSAWPADSTDPSNPWTTIDSAMIEAVPYSGASVAGSGTDAAQIAAFNFTGPPLDPSRPAFRHYCLLAIVDAPADPVSAESMTKFAPDLITPRDNNVTHRNVALQDPFAGVTDTGLWITNPFRDTRVMRVVVDVPDGWSVVTEGFETFVPFSLAGGKSRPISLRIKPGEEPSEAGIHVRQDVAANGRFRPLGGFLIDFRTKNTE